MSFVKNPGVYASKPRTPESLLADELLGDPTMTLVTRCCDLVEARRPNAHNHLGYVLVCPKHGDQGYVADTRTANE